MRLRSLSDDTSGAGFIGFVLPISATIFLVLMFHLLAKLGVGVPAPLLEPVFNLWIVFVGILFAVCVFMRQFFILFIAGVISFIATVFIYVMYVI